MRLGINMPYMQPDGTHPTIEDVRARAKLIEDVGFDGIWLGDPLARTPTPRPDPLLWLTICASATTRLEFGTSILQVPLRHPVELAQRLMTLHAVTNGRFVAGLGAGSTQRDFDAVGVDFESRFRLLNEGVPLIKALLKGEAVGGADLKPWQSAGAGPPIVIGSWESGLWVKRAARDYDGWMASAHSSLNGLAEGIKRFRDAGGTRALVATIDVDLSQPESELDPKQPFNLRCGPESARERLARLAELGYNDALIVKMNHTEATLNEEGLRAIRALVPLEVA
jgi:alkanesulfonate monooxygenase SsuD/methylene tetrahydromethanopterin reductase-like flavin-dependent oxidoreductase (luciferase family)